MQKIRHMLSRARRVRFDEVLSILLAEVVKTAERRTGQVVSGDVISLPDGALF